MVLSGRINKIENLEIFGHFKLSAATKIEAFLKKHLEKLSTTEFIIKTWLCCLKVGEVMTGKLNDT